MNIGHRDKLVLLGFLSHFPVAGVAWQTLHYLVGFQKLGFDVYYVEAHGCTPSKLMRHEHDDGAARAAEYIRQIVRRVGLEHRWAYHSIYDSRCFGLSQTQLKDLYGSAAFLINLHGSHLPTPELANGNRLVYLETDPVDVEIDLFHGKTETIDYLAPHCAFFTYGENLGNPDCLVPMPERFKFIPTRQPVVLDFWPVGTGPGNGFTTIGNWRQPWREFVFKGETYRWSKHLEFQKFLGLPSRTGQRFELALSSFNEDDRQLLNSHGWEVRSGMEVSNDPDIYRDYITNSRGEFTVAKEQNIRLRSGWFSDRAVTYLAAGRPVITQETGFSKHLPTGEGLFGFSTLEEAADAVRSIEADYQRHSGAARRIAEDCFSHEVVLGKMMRDLGLSKPGGGTSSPGSLASDLVIVPISRWPTRLPERTLAYASALPVPSIQPRNVSRAPVSVVVVTHNGLPYTKMCLTTLLSNDWQSTDELIVVDNASTDGTAEFLRELEALQPGVRVICNGRNAGFAAANNQGIASAKGKTLVLLNPDTLLLPNWRKNLTRWLEDKSVGMVGPVTNRTCNEAQIDAPYRTYGELLRFAAGYTEQHATEANAIAMLAMFCVAFRRDVFDRVGPLDEQFEVGMFEDDDYSRRVGQAGLKLLCAENVFVHHFGQGSFGELCATKQYDQVFEKNRARFEKKWQTTWRPQARRITPEYSQLRRQIQSITASRLPEGSTIAVISKGDEELLKLNGHSGWHFPRTPDGAYANIYPADGPEAVEQLQSIRKDGAKYLLIPRPAFWWLEHYAEFKQHLQTRCRLAIEDPEACLVFELADSHE